MSTQRVTRGAKFLGAVSLYGILSFVCAGAIVAVFPDQALAVLVGWILAAFIGGQLLRRQLLD